MHEVTPHEELLVRDGNHERYPTEPQVLQIHHVQWNMQHIEVEIIIERGKNWHAKTIQYLEKDELLD